MTEYLAVKTLRRRLDFLISKEECFERQRHPEAPRPDASRFAIQEIKALKIVIEKLA